MVINRIFELSMTLGSEHFQEILNKAYSKTKHIEERDGYYIDHSMDEKGITVKYYNGQYKKKVQLIVNTYFLLKGDMSNTDKLLQKLRKRIAEYFNQKYNIDDFVLSGMTIGTDIDVGSREKVSAYLMILHRIGKVKGFSPVSYERFDYKSSFCLRGNSNNIEVSLYDLEAAVVGQLRESDISRKKLRGASERTTGIIRAEVCLTKPKAIRVYTDAAGVSGQIMDMTNNSLSVFMEAFTRIIPFGDFYKKDKAMEIVCKEVKSSVMKRKMLRLLTLIPEKKSLYLAQKTMNCRNIEKVTDSFAKINLSPVTIGKRCKIRHLHNLYEYLTAE